MPTEIKVPLLDHYSWSDSKSLSAVLDQLNKYELRNESWPEFKTKCTASFAIAHENTSVLLKFYVKNDHFKSGSRLINEEVNNDNCVEFFISFAQDSAYYNLEFNCLGIGKVAYGAGRENRAFLSAESIRKIKVWTVSETVNESFDWEITLVIPVSVFEHHRLNTLKETNGKGNFYKCGDELPEPHFLSWNKIEAPEPDFHQPDYFVGVFFE